MYKLGNNNNKYEEIENKQKNINKKNINKKQTKSIKQNQQSFLSINQTVQTLNQSKLKSMWIQILSFSSISMGLYILFMFVYNLYIPEQSSTNYHLGCYSEENHLNHSASIKQFISNIKSQNQIYAIDRKSFTLQNKINYNDVSKAVARDFQKFLNQYYQIKTKSVYEQNYYTSLGIAEEKYETCKKEITTKFDQQKCLNTYQDYLQSDEKYVTLKKTLTEKIERKEQQERKISYLILDTNYADVEQYQLNLTNQITLFNSNLQIINNKKIDLLTKRVHLQDIMMTNKSKLITSQTLLDECVKNMKIINFCNELNEELKSIKITFTKQDLQKKIQRKQMIIDTHLNAIRNAEKLQDNELVEFNRKNLVQNQQQLKLLQERLEDFKSFEQSYCSQCSEEKINQLKAEVQHTRIIIAQYEVELQNIINQQKNVANQILVITTKIHQIEQERDFNINSKICLTEQCQQQRSQDLFEYGRTLNQLKKDVLDYKFELQEHRIEHGNKLKKLNQWIVSINQVINCLNDKQYFSKLRENRPKHNQNQLIKIEKVKEKIVKQLQNFSKI